MRCGLVYPSTHRSVVDVVVGASHMYLMSTIHPFGVGALHVCVTTDLITPDCFLFLSAEPQREELETNIKENLIATARGRGQGFSGTNYPTFDTKRVRFHAVQLVQRVCSLSLNHLLKSHSRYLLSAKRPSICNHPPPLSPCVACHQLKQWTGASQV